MSRAMSKTALFVIDIQNELAHDDQTEIPRAAEIREAGGEILGWARSYIDEQRGAKKEPSLKLVFVQHSDPEGEEESTLLQGSNAWKLVFEPRENDEAEQLVSKTTRDTFESNPKLAERLKAEGISKIVAFGVQSEYCVVSTIKGALAAGFQATLLKGAHSTYSTQERNHFVIENDIEEEVGGLGVRLLRWEDWRPT